MKVHKLSGTNKLHKQLSLLKINELAKLRLLLTSHKAIYDRENINIALNNMKKREREDRQLRNFLDFKIHANYFFNKNKVTEHAMVLWNELNHRYKVLSSRDKFKSEIHKFYLKNYD